MTRPTSILPLLILTTVALSQLSGFDSIATKPGPRRDLPSTPKGEGATTPSPISNSCIPQQSLQKLIDELDQGEEVTDPMLPDNDPFNASMKVIVDSQKRPKGNLKKVETTLKDEDRKLLEKAAATIAQDLTIWDRLRDALDQPTAAARRFTADDSVAPDSTRHLHARLEQMKESIDNPPDFHHKPSDLDRYLPPPDKARKGMPHQVSNERRISAEDISETQKNGDAAGNATLLRTLDLRLAILERLRDTKPPVNPGPLVKPEIKTLEAEASRLRMVPANESAESQRERETKLQAAGKKLRAHYDFEAEWKNAQKKDLQ